MRLSVIVSTFNQPDWLELVLWGLAGQTVQEYDLLIADDGSDDRTRRVLERIRVETSLEPLHVWQPDTGFGKCAILNRSIERATGEYILFLDGDCVPRRDFIERHTALSERGRFLSGGAVRLTKAVSARMTSAAVQSRQSHEWRWLRSQGQPWSKDRLKLRGGGRFGEGLFGESLLDAITPTRATFNGGNVSVWREDLLRVNGFDERMGHGGLDRELGERLENAGVHGKQVRHRCVCVHLDHPRGYADPEGKAFNDRLRAQTRASRSVWTPYGIVKAAISDHVSREASPTAAHG